MSTATIQGPVQATVTTTALAGGFCPTSEQDRLDTYATRTVVSLPTDYSTFVVGSDKPTNQLVGVWLKLDASGRPERWFTFAEGAWLSPHLVPIGYIQLYMGDIASIKTFDGGEDIGATPTSVYAGPFWEEVTEAKGRTIVHPDPTRTLIQFQSVTPFGGGAPINNIAFGSSGGEERHTLSPNEIPDHAHTIPMQVFQTNAIGGAGANVLIAGAGQNTGNPTNSSTNDQPHNNMQPFIGIYLIRRTIRTHYKVNA